MHQLPGLAWIKDSKGRYVFVNGTAEKVFSQSSNEIIGRTDFEIFSEEVARQFTDNDREAIESRSGIQVIEKLEHDDGVVHHSLVTKFPVPDPHGGPPLIGGMAIDITEHLRAEAALEESEQRFRLMADNAPVLIWINDEDDRSIFMNAEYTRFMGRPAEELVGLGWLDFLHPEDATGYFEAYQAATSLRQRFEADCRIRRADGVYRWMRSVGVPRFEDGVYRGYVGCTSDVHDARLAEDELRAAGALKDQFLGLVSHELRTPLSTVIVNASLLKSRADKINGRDRQQALTDIVTEASRLQGIIENLLGLARVNAADPLELREIQLRDLVAHRIEVFGRRQPTRHVTLLADEFISEVLAEPNLIAIVVDNLINNADKYSPPETSIEVMVRETEGGHVQVEVRDYGIGIDDGEIELLLEPFYRSEPGRQASTGMGLGLAACKRIVEAHSGRIWGASRRGEGASFWFKLPSRGR
jgi:two-component system CheB/CheR fusion protein